MFATWQLYLIGTRANWKCRNREIARGSKRLFTMPGRLRRGCNGAIEYRDCSDGRSGNQLIALSLVLRLPRLYDRYFTSPRTSGRINRSVITLLPIIKKAFDLLFREFPCLYLHLHPLLTSAHFSTGGFIA